MVVLPAVLALLVGTPSPSADARAPRSAALEQPASGLERSLDLQGMRADVWARAKKAWEKARAQGVVKRDRLVVIDYTLPSTEERLFVLDMQANRVLFKDLVAHGKGSGNVKAERFSNVPGSLATSVGVFVTADIYRGEHGKSLRLDGLEPGFNDKARERAIVIHPADYVDRDLIPKQGRIGRSWGCPALPPGTSSEIIDAIAGGALVFAWGDDAEWQQRSAFLR